MTEKICNVVLNLYDNAIKNTYFNVENTDINAYRFKIYLKDRTGISPINYNLSSATDIQLIFKCQTSTTTTTINKSANIVSANDGLCEYLITGSEFSSISSAIVTVYTRVEQSTNSNPSFLLSFSPFTFVLKNDFSGSSSTTPVLVSASTSSSGRTINLTFSKSMADPTGHISDFTVKADSTTQIISAISYGSSKSGYILSLVNSLSSKNIVTISYSGTVTALDGTSLSTFTDVVVINNISTTSGSNVSLDTTNFNHNLDTSITDVQKLADAVDELSGGSSTTYTNNTPTWISVGGIGTGSTFASQTMTQMWNSLLYPFTPCVVSFSTTPTASVQENGTSISSVVLTANITKKSNNIAKIEYYKNSSLIHTNLSPNVSGGTDTYTDSTEISTTTVYYVKVYDDTTNSVTSNSITFTYVYGMYIGNISNATPTETDVKSMTKRIVSKSNQSYTYTISASRFCFAYPTNYGASLSSILDQNGFEMVSSFTKTTLDMAMTDSKVVNYTVYTLSSPTTQTNFVVTYKF